MMKTQILAFVATLCLLSWPATTRAQDAHWSLQGDFQDADDSVQLFFELRSGGVRSAETFYGATYGHSGGTNGAGSSISGGGFDPQLWLYDVTGGGEVLRGENDDGWPGYPADRDARLSWPGVASQGGAINTDPLPDGDYRMDLVAYQADYPGGTSPWAMDLVGPWVPLEMAGIATTGDASVWSLKFGSTPGNAAWFDLTESSATIAGELVVGTSGVGQLFVNANTTLTTSGNTVIGGGGEGFATIAGANAQWDAGFVSIGNPAGTGNGSLLVTNQATVWSGDVTVAANAANGDIVIDGTVAEPGARTRWDLVGSLDIGSTGLGSGTVTLMNDGLMTASQDVHVFGSIDARSTLTLQTNGGLHVNGQIDVDRFGSVELLGGIITAQSFVVDPGGTFTHEDGMLTVDGGLFTMEFGTLTIDSGGTGRPTLRLDNGARGTVEVNPGVTPFGDAGNISIGNDGRGRMEIMGGSHLVSGAGSIAHGATFPGSGEGSVLVQGAGSVWELTGATGWGRAVSSLQVGRNGAGTLEIRDAGQVVVHDSSVGIGSPWLFDSAGQGGPGIGIIDGAGALLQITDTRGVGEWLAIGALPPSVGGVGPSGARGALTVSNQGRIEVDGTLQVLDAGSLLLRSGGEIAVGSFVVDPGGTFTHEDGTLTVDGGTFDPGVADYTLDGLSATDLPIVRLTNGATALLNGSSGVIGKARRGRLEIVAGSHVDAPLFQGGLVIALNASASGSSVTVRDAGSRLNVVGPIDVGGDSASVGGDGVLTVANGALVMADHVKVWQPGSVELDGGMLSASSMEVEGQLIGNGAILLEAGEAVINRGIVSPGLSPGVLTISGSSAGHNYVQEAAGLLRIEIGGTSPNQYDRLNVVAGSATLGGLLDVALLDLSGGGNPFLPSDGDLFEIVTAADGLGGTRFANERLPTLPGGRAWNVLYGANTVTLEVFLPSFLAGDFDEDGDVDGDDLSAWKTGFGTQIGAAHGDGDGDADADVDGNDFLLWQRQFGSTGGGAAFDAVPEPAAAWLACLGGLIVLGFRRRVSACGAFVGLQQGPIREPCRSRRYQPARRVIG